MTDQPTPDPPPSGDPALAAELAAWSAQRERADNFDGRWACFEEGCALLERGLLAGDAPAIGEALVGLHDLRGELDGAPELPAAIIAALDVIEEHLEETLADTALPRQQQARELEAMRLRRQQLRALVEGGKPLLQLKNDLDSMTRAVLRLEQVDPHEAALLKQRTDALRAQALELLTERDVEELDSELEAAGEDRLAALSARWDAISDLERHASTAWSMPGTEPLRDELDRRRELLREAVKADLEAIASEQRAGWLSKAAEDERELAEEALTSIEDLDTEGGVAALERSIQRIDVLQQAKDITPTASKQLQGYRKRLFNEWVEKTVVHRLEGRFGASFVSLLEITVLLLILVVCVQLMAEYMAPEWAHTWRWELAIADGFICAVFLFEFFIKLYYSPSRGNYFKRHWLTDLLPSVPFGLITLMLEGALRGAQNVGFLRLLRLPRLLRLLRVLRPVFRIGRILMFALRGMDRVVRRYGSVINRNIVFFNPKPEVDEDAREIEYRLDSLRLRSRGAKLAMLVRMEPEDRRAHQAMVSRMIEARLDHFAELSVGARSRETAVGAAREVRIEQVIETLTRLHASELAEHFGPDFTKRVNRLVQVASLPGVRRLPLLSDVAAARIGAADETEAVTRAARALGRGLQRVLSGLYWVADLYGVLSASQIVDKLGATMVKVSERPTKRLMMFGGGFLLLSLVLWVSHISWLEPVAKKISTILGLPIIILGSICLIVLILGKWFQRVAGAAGEFYERAAEAQFLGLSKDIKQTHIQQHRRVLETRILRPEAMLRGVGMTNVARKHEDLAHQLAAVLDPTGDVVPGGPAERVYFLYRHFLDGAPLHRTGVTTTNQLLGNLVIENIQRGRLRYSKAQMNRLLGLDLERAKGLAGPAVWFNFITLSIAQRTARLVVEYNLHCVPISQRALYGPAELEHSDAWLRARLNLAEDERAAEEKSKGEPTSSETHYRTVAFSAIDFMTNDPERDAAIEGQFGAQVLEALQRDRRNLIRETFGTFPFATWPVADRSINPYDLYWRFLGNGRALLLPLTMSLLALKLGYVLIKQLISTMIDLLNPSLGASADARAVSDFEIAVRKINRLRKPVLMEASRLRAEFDVEYTGLHLPGYEKSGLEGGIYEDDLKLIGALDQELLAFTQIKRRHRDRLQTMQAFLPKLGLDRAGIQEYIETHCPGLDGREREVLRAVASAFAVNHAELATLAKLALRLERDIEEAIKNEGQIPGDTLARRVASAAARGATAWTPSAAKLRSAFDLYWDAHYAERSEEEREYARTYALRNPEFGRRLKRAAKVNGDPERAARDAIEEVAHHPQEWTEQLLTVRAVQTMALLDVYTDRDLVRDLGQYEDADRPCRPVTLPLIKV